MILPVKKEYDSDDDEGQRPLDVVQSVSLSVSQRRSSDQDRVRQSRVLDPWFKRHFG